MYLLQRLRTLKPFREEQKKLQLTLMARLTEKRDLDVLLRIDAQVTFKLKLKESLHKLVALI